jgi:hypothetical protein
MAVEFIPGIVEGGVHRAGAAFPLIMTTRLTLSMKILVLPALPLSFYKSPFLFCYLPHRERTDLPTNHSSLSSIYAEELTRFRRLR